MLFCDIRKTKGERGKGEGRNKGKSERKKQTAKIVDKEKCAKRERDDGYIGGLDIP